MTIQDVYNYSALYVDSKVNQMQSVDLGEAQNDALAIGSAVNKISYDDSINSMKASKYVDLEHISLTFVAEDTFGYIGSERNVENLDVMQAISDMQKDSVLHQYQTFVSMDEPIFSSEDGMVFLK